MLIDHLNNKVSIRLGSIAHWLERVEIQKKSFAVFSFHHVFRENNVVADRLSKKGLEGNYGEMHYQLLVAEGRGAAGTIHTL